MGNVKCLIAQLFWIVSIRHWTSLIPQIVHKTPAKKIFQEVLHKVEIVLGINEAPPHDPAFLKPGAHLSPLEQKYAQPRLYDHKHKDEYGIRAQ